MYVTVSHTVLTHIKEGHENDNTGIQILCLISKIWFVNIADWSSILEYKKIVSLILHRPKKIKNEDEQPAKQQRLEGPTSITEADDCIDSDYEVESDST